MWPPPPNFLAGYDCLLSGLENMDFNLESLDCEMERASSVFGDPRSYIERLDWKRYNRYIDRAEKAIVEREKEYARSSGRH